MSSIRIRREGYLYSVSEEIANSITHGLGALLSIAGTIILILVSVFQQDIWKIVSSSIYGGSLILLFTMSSLYHALTNKKAKQIFRIFDHSSIYILIAGTYTPLTLVTLRGPIGWTIFSIVWGTAFLGITLNSISIERFKKISMFCYLASGWCIIVMIMPMIRAMAHGGLLLLFLGGIMYTGGVLFYKKKEIQYMHSIWHIFVLAGSVLHYFCILFYVIKL
ncbi:MAG: hemolysin III family protein [Clostridiales bacterium]|nr:hemolysin III family protein [Clostridiales bacterium]